MDKTRIQPVGGDHAIEVMAIGVEWSSPLDESCLHALQSIYTESQELKESFPQFSPVQAFLIQETHQIGVVRMEQQPHLGPEGITPPQFVTKAAGFDANRVDVNGKISWGVSIRPDFLSCNCTAYDRWKNVKPRVVEALLPFIEAAIGLGAEISAIGLQYQDAFRLLDGISPETTKQLFRQDSRCIPSHLFDEPSFWHCHQGWFSNGCNSRRILNNITTDLAEVDSVHFARIGGQHRIFSVSFDGKTQNRIETCEIDEVLEGLHEENKKVINEMLSDGALEAIGCVVEGA
ncbi:TIGR04255 family protein [Methylomonas rhizoryzae]|uniref:TIGR04255 family protein n=1 Tax=Methylomonas rhizoryzae TaxID=2608981 RepID=UPI00123237B7|nr:TIGR04255 family protein [Methylomonas rhizoryzae]